MLKLTAELAGSQTSTHCSMASSIGACEKLNIGYKKCIFYREKLEYGEAAHAYKRCGRCIKGEVKEVEPS